jgi:hypothetical protein
MSDQFDPFAQQDPGYDPNAVDPATAALIQQLVGAGYQSYPQMLNVPYTKDLLGVGTDPLRNLGGAQTRYKSAASIMDYNPVQQFAGPEFQPYVPQYDAVAQEAQGDQYAEALLNDLQQGQGALALANQIDSATYNPKIDGGPVEGKPLSPEQAKNYKSWLSRAQKAYTADSLELGKRDQQATEGDVNSMVPTQEAQSFNEDQWINKIAQTGALGPQRQQDIQSEANLQDVRANAKPGDAGRYMFPSSFNTPTGKTPVALQGKKPPLGASQSPSSWSGKAANRGYNQREQGYRQDARGAVQNAVQPSPARERAVRAVMAYRLAMGLPAS